METLFLIVILIFSAVIHELAHGVVAYKLGDSTAKYAGRLTLNPLKHLDPIGSVFFPLILIILSKMGGGGIIFGWAKPVPVNPYNFRNPRNDFAKVAVAGPASNLLIALFFGLILRLVLVPAGISVDLAPPFNFGDAIAFIVYINILLAVFNLLPIPPLDGSHILFRFLPLSAQNLKIILNQYGFLILILLIFFFFPWISLIINVIFSLITGI